jgi:IS605 OrfB family transposase
MEVIKMTLKDREVTTSIKTISIKLKCNSAEEQNKIVSMLKMKTDCFNYLSKKMFENNDYKGKYNFYTIHNKYYYELKQQFQQLMSQMIIKVEQEVVATYKTIKVNKHKITSAPQQNNLCLQMDKRLYSRMTKESICLPSLKDTKRIKCEYVLYDRALNFLNNNTPHDPKLFFKNNELYIAIPFEVATPLPDNEDCLGVDLGVRCLASCSDGRVFQCKDFKEVKRRLKYNQRQLQQKNTKSSRKHLKKVRRKIHNYSKNYIHHLTNEILRTDKNNIVLENLKKIKEKTKCFKNTNHKRTHHNRAFGDIPIYMIQSFLSYKASVCGKRTVYVSAAYTSQKDCRGCAVGVREGRRYYCNDGLQFDADVNATVNIANTISELPISYPEKVTYIGRLLSTSRSNLFDESQTVQTTVL